MLQGWAKKNATVRASVVLADLTGMYGAAVVHNLRIFFITMQCMHRVVGAIAFRGVSAIIHSAFL
ncbi:MAG: hypothetical protein EAY75_17625 [Bacteroidetes bacterium]|nr:MAG: hypothetical protein EAY75_17625 [Bacteroidota bacterium]